MEVSAIGYIPTTKALPLSAIVFFRECIKIVSQALNRFSSFKEAANYRLTIPLPSPLSVFQDMFGFVASGSFPQLVEKVMPYRHSRFPILFSV